MSWTYVNVWILFSVLRKSGYGPFHLKSQAPAKFNEEKVAPSLDVNFSPSILATSYDHWINNTD